MTLEQIAALWAEYLEAATPSGSTDLYDIEDMNDAAYALHQCCIAQAAELERLRAALTEIAACLDGSPDYHTQGMGCGLEDRGITDRYDAMQYGWDEALDRVYSEHVSGALDVAYAALKGGA